MFRGFCLHIGVLSSLWSHLASLKMTLRVQTPLKKVFGVFLSMIL